MFVFDHTCQTRPPAICEGRIVRISLHPEDRGGDGERHRRSSRNAVRVKVVDSRPFVKTPRTRVENQRSSALGSYRQP